MNDNVGCYYWFKTVPYTCTKILSFKFFTVPPKQSDYDDLLNVYTGDKYKQFDA